MKKLGFGLMRLPTAGGDITDIDLELTCRMADCFLEQGFTYFDTAYVYHQGFSERTMKEAVVKRHPRESFLLADKMPTYLVTAQSDYDKFFAEQLERTGVEYFDYYLLHNLGELNYANCLEHGGFEYMQKLKAEGKARNIGFSFHDKAELLDKILTNHPEMEFVQLQINYVDWENENIEGRKCYEVAVRHQKPVIVMEPIKGGSLAKVPSEAEKLFLEHSPERSVASWALRFAAAPDNVIMVLSGMSDLEQMKDNCKVLGEDIPLSEKEREIIGKASQIIEGKTAIPCTACRYCVDDCPVNIPIPDYLSLYNDCVIYEYRPYHWNYYNNLAQRTAKAGDCIKCRACEANCPQHIKISEELAHVAGRFEND